MGFTEGLQFEQILLFSFPEPHPEFFQDAVLALYLSPPAFCFSSPLPS